MPKNPNLPPQAFPVTTNATTASPHVVAAITPSPVYQSMTAAVVLTRENGVLKVSVFRASTSPDALGQYSRDDYARAPDGHFKKTGKAKGKFLRPEVPQGAKLTKIGDVELYTLYDISEKEIDQLLADLPELLRD
jgi:hypothetical protein